MEIRIKQMKFMQLQADMKFRLLRIVQKPLEVLTVAKNVELLELLEYYLLMEIKLSLLPVEEH
ncbi:hypothetical protein D3C86_2016920 [compost metagenome]